MRIKIVDGWLQVETGDKWDLDFLRELYRGFEKASNMDWFSLKIIFPSGHEIIPYSEDIFDLLLENWQLFYPPVDITIKHISFYTDRIAIKHLTIDTEGLKWNL